jgi:hypothetical protein
VVTSGGREEVASGGREEVGWWWYAGHPCRYSILV